jgi:hypothetical protein
MIMKNNSILLRHCQSSKSSESIFFAHLVQTRKNAQVVADLQTSRNKVVVKPISGCVRTACSQLL